MLKGPRTSPLPPALPGAWNCSGNRSPTWWRKKGNILALTQARSSAVYYMRGLRGAPALRRACCSLTSLSDLDGLIEKVLEENPGL